MRRPADVQPKYWGQYKPYASAPGRLQYAKRAHAMGGGQTAVASAEPAMAAARSGSDAGAAAAAPEPLERAEAERPIPIRFEHQPGETQMRRTSISREVDRSVREATLNSYADAGFA